jgi:hypothetical protein
MKFGEAFTRKTFIVANSDIAVALPGVKLKATQLDACRKETRSSANKCTDDMAMCLLNRVGGLILKY